MYKYFLSVAAILKNESYNFIEWIEHYLAQGIEHFYLIDNGDNEKYIQYIQLYIEKGIIDLFIDPQEIPQIELYNKHIYCKAKEETQWIASICLNEFAYAQHDDKIINTLKKDIYSDTIQICCPVVSFKYNELAKQNIYSYNNNAKLISLVESFVKREKYVDITITETRLFERTNKPTLFINQYQCSIFEDVIPIFDILVNHYIIQPPKHSQNINIIHDEIIKNEIDDTKLYNINKDLFLKLNGYQIPTYVVVNNNIINAGKILYGISEDKSINITETIIKRLRNKTILSTSDNIHRITNYDPYPGLQKKMFIYENFTNLPKPQIIINENFTNLPKPQIIINENFTNLPKPQIIINENFTNLPKPQIIINENDLTNLTKPQIIINENFTNLPKPQIIINENFTNLPKPQIIINENFTNLPKPQIIINENDLTNLTKPQIIINENFTNLPKPQIIINENDLTNLTKPQIIINENFTNLPKPQIIINENDLTNLTKPQIIINENDCDLTKPKIIVNENDLTNLTKPKIIINKNDCNLTKPKNIVNENDCNLTKPKIIINENDCNLTKPKIIINENDCNLASDLYLLKIDKKNINILIYLIYHDENSYKMIEKYKNYKYVKLFYNESTKYFESNIFKYLNENKQEWMDKDYVGMLTYSFEAKINASLDIIYKKLIHKLAAKNYDLVTLLRYLSRLSGSLHGKIREIFDYTLPMFGFSSPIDYSAIRIFFCNYWLTKPVWMVMYLEFVLKYIDVLENTNDKYLQEMLYSNANYREGQLSKPKLQQIMGVPYYTNHCFVLERLPGVFFWKHSIIPNILWLL